MDKFTGFGPYPRQQHAVLYPNMVWAVRGATTHQHILATSPSHPHSTDLSERKTFFFFLQLTTENHVTEKRIIRTSYALCCQCLFVRDVVCDIYCQILLCTNTLVCCLDIIMYLLCLAWIATTRPYRGDTKRNAVIYQKKKEKKRAVMAVDRCHPDVVDIEGFFFVFFGWKASVVMTAIIFS